MRQNSKCGIAIHNKPFRLMSPPHDSLEIEFLPAIVLPNISGNRLEPALVFRNRQFMKECTNQFFIIHLYRVAKVAIAIRFDAFEEQRYLASMIMR